MVYKGTLRPKEEPQPRSQVFCSTRGRVEEDPGNEYMNG